jgi:hypothetical protein
MNRLARASLALALVVAAGLPAAARQPQPEASLQAARLAYDQGRFDIAWTGYAGLADLGHPVAARQALMMWTEGHARFGRGFIATDEQLARWTRFSACGGHCSDGEVAASGC